MEKLCPVCTKPVLKKANVTCSRSCANSFFRSGINNPGYQQGKKNYRSICFKYHVPKCVVCSEDKIIDVHHVNEDHDHNDPSNLIFLCPTHHRYWHSKFRGIIEETVFAYREQFLESAPLLDRYEEEIEFD